MPYKDKEKRRAAQQKWVEKNREKVRKIGRDWAARNREHVRAYHNEYSKRPEALAKKAEWLEKNREKMDAYHQEYRDTHKEQQAAHLRRYRDETRAKVNEYKRSKGCPCGERDIRVLDFHHRDPDQKVCSVSSLLSCTWDKVMVEIEKCDVLCANCHRRAHDGGKDQYRRRIAKQAQQEDACTEPSAG